MWWMSIPNTHHHIHHRFSLEIPGPEGGWWMWWMSFPLPPKKVKTDPLYGSPAVGAPLWG